MKNSSCSWGGGDHTGHLRLASDKEGLLTLRANTGRKVATDVFNINLGRVPQLPQREVVRVVVEYTTSDKALEITLPGHAQARPPSPGPSAPPRSPFAANGRVDVTDKIAGGGPKPPRYAPQSGVRGQ